MATNDKQTCSLQWPFEQTFPICCYQCDFVIGIYGATAEYPATLVRLIYMCREALKIEAWHVNEWPGILEFSRNGVYHFPTEFIHQNSYFSLRLQTHPSQRLGNLFKINLVSVYCNSVDSAKASCRVLNANPRPNAHFRAFVIGEHAVLENWFIHLVIYSKLISATRLFRWCCVTV